MIPTNGFVVPILKEYAEGYKKDGNYVHAPISNLDHPLPLQTPEVTGAIYEELGYTPGDNVPNELTWRLYDVGLHWTESSGPQQNPEDLSADDLKDDGPSLTETDIESIDSLLEDYRGQYSERVADLRKQLNQSSEPESEFHSQTPRSFKDLPEDVRGLIDDWEPLNLIDNPDGDGLIQTYRGDYRADIAACSDVAETVRQFDSHPWEVWRIRGYSDADALEIELDTESEELNRLSVVDYRAISDPRDFKLQLSIPEERFFEFAIKDGYIADFETGITFDRLGKFDLSQMDHWEDRKDRKNTDMMHHVLVSDFMHLVPLIVEFFEQFDEYELASTKIEDHSVHLSP